MIENNYSKEELLYLVASAEAHSNHPIAKSIKKTYNKELAKVTNYKEISGKGIECKINKDKILVGSRSLLEDNKIASEKTNELGTIIHIAKNKEYLGYIVITDKIKDNAKKSLQELKENGIKNIIILSGDDASVVSEISKKFKIDESFGNLLPEDKVKILEKFKYIVLIS